MYIDVEEFLSLCYDKSLINSLGFKETISSLEGFLYPDTYFLLKSYDEKDIIRVFINHFNNKYNSINKDRYLLNNYDTIILASIIQAESKYKADMDTISSVFHNRLRDGWPLQADPTIQYLLPERKERLLFKDIEDYKNSPYNTYKNYGLTPTPINNPGLDAINAALYPPITSYMFFVADGTGTHTFNVNNEGHNKSKKNVTRKSK